ncbi:MAG: Catabolite control protein A [Lentisphaerae bacterium ADurb.Bin242]|nr:MAG: Catabolite control protein A [Lentisphaerae bacterium ADurb.Bin242]
MKVRLSDIAKLLNMDKGSISRILHGGKQAEKYAEETRRKVHAAALKMGYRRDDMAAAISTGRINASGFLGNGNNEYCSKLLMALLDGSSEFGHLIKPMYFNALTQTSEIVDFCIRQRLVALTVFSFIANAEVLRKKLGEHGILLLIAGPRLAEQDANTLEIDNYGSGCKAFQYLYNLGHRSFAFLGGKVHSMPFPEAFEWSDMREKGFLKTAADAGIAILEKNIIRTDLLYDEHVMKKKGAVKRFFTSGKAPTAVFAVNDHLAMNIQMRLMEAGLKIPDDVSVLGCGNARFSFATYPRLSTISDPMDEIGACAIGLIRKHYEEGNVPGHGIHKRFDSHIMEFNSTGKPKCNIGKEISI